MTLTSTTAGSTSAPTTVTLLPPNPATVAPPLNHSVATDPATATAFLYAGPSPVQIGVAPSTIDPVRVAVLRGKVLDASGAPRSGVTITILNHPEFGLTLSRADGMFDMAVNGGGPLTVSYTKTGLLPAQRTLNPSWQSYLVAPDVILLPLDPQVTAITLGASTMQAARGSAMTDADGTRQATVLFPAGTTATMVMPDNSTQPLTTLHVHATEYTVGPNGPKAVPAQLPPNSGYTYAVEFSAEEEIAAGAKTILFSQPVMVYLENFLGFPAGTVVPLGSYDRGQGAWLPENSGRVDQDHRGQRRPRHRGHRRVDLIGAAYAQRCRAAAARLAL